MLSVTTVPNQASWDHYLSITATGCFSQRFFFAEQLARSYDLPLFRLAVVDRAGAVRGVLPLILFSPPGKPRRLISLPYNDSSGIATDSDQAIQLLIHRALTLAEEHDASHLELRQQGVSSAEIWPRAAQPPWRHHVHDFKTGLIRPLPSSVEILWASLSTKVRNQVRKARRNDCRVTIGGPELLKEFYAVFSENMRDLGSPVHDITLFSNLLHSPHLSCRIVLVRLAGEPAAAAMVFLHKGTITNPWAASLRKYRPLCPNMLLYWAMMKEGIDSGCSRFDFGRSSPGASTCRFKEQWGAKRTPLHWHVYSRGTEDWDPRSESLVDEEWKTLSLEVSRQEGPAQRRWISL